MAGGSTIGGKKTRGRRKRREPDTVVEPYQASLSQKVTEAILRKERVPKVSERKEN